MPPETGRPAQSNEEAGVGVNYFAAPAPMAISPAILLPSPSFSEAKRKRGEQDEGHRLTEDELPSVRQKRLRLSDENQHSGPASPQCVFTPQEVLQALHTGRIASGGGEGDSFTPPSSPTPQQNSNGNTTQLNSRVPLSSRRRSSKVPSRKQEHSHSTRQPMEDVTHNYVPEFLLQPQPNFTSSGTPPSPGPVRDEGALVNVADVGLAPKAILMRVRGMNKEIEAKEKELEEEVARRKLEIKQMREKVGTYLDYAAIKMDWSQESEEEDDIE